MKLVYCIHSICNPGGMERVLLNKIAYLASQLNWNIIVVTTDQKNRPPFYPFPANVRMVDLDINYSDDNDKNIFLKVTGYLRRRRRHKKALTAFLIQERVDIVVSLYPSESSFLPEIKDGSKKVLELHYCKFFRLQYGRDGLLGWIDRYRTRQDERIVRRFDKFVILTNEDRNYWGDDVSNIEVIPNAALFISKRYSEMLSHRVIAVGRLDYQKGFDRLLDAWTIISKRKEYKDWRLDIFGQGEWQDKLQQMIDNGGMSGRVCINKPTKQIGDEYVNSSMLVMSSNYEGFPMVMIEAMACGLPVVSFDYKCGPKDVIRQGVNGLLVHNGDIEGLAEAMMKLMGDEAYRQELSANARKVTETYSEEVVMDKWVKLFTSLVDK